MIEVLVGMINSGKSSWAANRAKEGWVIINDDAIVMMVHGGDYLAYQKEWKPLYKSIEDHILHTSLAMDKNVLIDRGVDVRASSRQRWINIGQACDVQVRAVLFEVFPPEIHAARRHASDSRGHTLQYWTDTARVHYQGYVEPRIQEGFCEIIRKNWIKQT